MTVKEYIITDTQKSLANLFEAARKVPADKHEWKPLDNGRSVLDLAQECALCPLWVPGILTKRSIDMADFETAQVEQKKLTTLDACEAAAKANLETMKAAIMAFPDEEMDEEITLPWGTYTLGEVMGFPAWNLNYHLGQINYIQTLYGDFSM